jgi:hypothetical protein
MFEKGRYINALDSKFKSTKDVFAARRYGGIVKIWRSPTVLAGL